MKPITMGKTTPIQIHAQTLTPIVVPLHTASSSLLYRSYIISLIMDIIITIIISLGGGSPFIVVLVVIGLVFAFLLDGISCYL